MDEAAEEIPDLDHVSRAFFRSSEADRLHLDPESHFNFVADKKKNNERAESFYWRKYAREVESVHLRGYQLEARKNQRLQSKGKPSVRYVGCGTTEAGAVRAVRTRAFKLSVVHCTEDGDRAHTHVLIHDLNGQNVKKMPPNDQRELVSDLFKLLQPIQPRTDA